MGFVASSNRFVDAAWVVAAAALGISVALALHVLAMRRRRVARERAREAFVTAWRPLMFDRFLGGGMALPAVRAHEEESFLLLWVQLQDGLRGHARVRFNELALAAGALGMARRRLRRWNALGRMLALRTLGHLGSTADYDDVLRCLDARRSYLCLAGAHALVQIDPRRAPDDILPRLAARVDWPVPLFRAVLAEADRARLPALFRDLVGRVPESSLPRLVPLVSMLDRGAAEDVLRDLLGEDRDAEVLCAALKVVSSAALLPQVRRACEHREWPVRAQAAAALGRTGGLPERDLLVARLADGQWWVRYRAAQALCSGKFGSAAEIRGLAARLQDRFAHDIVEQALAEVSA